jgi:hypothetical protein
MILMETCIPFKAARAARIVRRLCMQCHILHSKAVSPMISKFRRCSKISFCMRCP